MSEQAKVAILQEKTNNAKNAKLAGVALIVFGGVFCAIFRYALGFSILVTIPGLISIIMGLFMALKSDYELNTPITLKATEEEIVTELNSENLDVDFAITSYNDETKAVYYRLSSRNPDLEVPKEAQAIVDKHLKEYKECQPNFLLYHRR